jgi:Holliday junction resolvase RusA-like endonuclease
MGTSSVWRWLVLEDAAEPTIVRLSFPPALNNLFANGAKGRYRTPRYDAWLAEAGLLIRRQRPNPLPGHFRCEMVFDRPDERRRDIDGLAKAPLDALTKAGVVVDDSLCTDLRLRWSGMHARKPGGLLIFLEAFR